MKLLIMNTRVLSVLMWKHAVVRKRRFIQTAVDFLSPLAFFILLFAFKDNLNPLADAVARSEQKDPVANTDILSLTEIMPAPYWILYYPETPLTDRLMKDVGAKLNLEKLESLNHLEKGYFPLSSKSQLNDYMSKARVLETLIIFQNMSGDTWPARLNYTIRMKTDFRTDTYQPQDTTPGPHRMFGYKYGTFMRVQWAIDTSYISLLSGSDVPLALSLQEFPYYHTYKNIATDTICKLLMVISWLSMMLTFVFLMCRLVEERTSGIQELMKMVGVSNNTLGVTHFLNVLPCGLVLAIGGTILLKVSSNPLLPNSNGILIVFMLLLYFNTIVSLAFACSYITRGTQYAATLSVLAYVTLWVPTRVLSEYTIPYLATVASGFLPHIPIYWFWKEVSMLEAFDRGASFGNMAETHAFNNGSVLLSFFFMLLQSVIFYFLAWYLSLVRPGQYGQALPWNFLCKAQYWTNNEVKPDADSEEEDPMTHDPRYFEEVPLNTEVGIKVVNVSKIYRTQRALRNVSLEVHKGDITVLLGHNGAGKTTLMSIITGMTSATGGKVFVNGKDTVTEQAEVRKNIGLCPQHNLFFDDLTVEEHIMFFTLLKRGTFSEAREASSELTDRLSLSGKRNALMKELSGGMKRRVQLACALAGGADVLVLDEPTSGLDVETRRELWDLLLSLRGERTVLLTTHFMEEADALGDRVAALHAGRLTCFATTMHLKRAVGTGYRLSFTTVGTPKEEEISKVVTQYVPDATVKEQTMNTISYNLPPTYSSKFPNLFTSLESKKAELGIDIIGVGVSTLEEVFLKLCSNITLSEDEVDNPEDQQEKPVNLLTGFPLYMRQFFVLLKRHAKYALHKKWAFLTWQVVIPIVLIFVLTYSTNYTEVASSRSMAMNLDLYGNNRDKRVMYHVELPGVDTATIRKQFPKASFQDTEDIATAILRTGKKDIIEYNKYLVGVELNETDAKILYTTTVRHAAPVALNMLSNILATRFISWADGKTITTMNNPILKEGATTGENRRQQKNSVSLFTWGICVTFIVLSTTVNSVSLPCKERSAGSRHIYVMAGCAAELYWGATLLAHTVVCVVGLLLPVAVFALVLERDGTIDQPDLLGTFIFILLLGCLAFFAFMYLVSFHFDEKGTTITLIACVIIFGVLTPFLSFAYDSFFETSPPVVLGYVMSACGYVFAPHSMVTAALHCLLVGHTNAWCKLAREYCPHIIVEDSPDTVKCCQGVNPRCYFCFDDLAPGKEMVTLVVQFIVMMAMVIITERGIFNGLRDKLMNFKYQPTQPEEQDDMLRAEKDYVSKAITLPDKQIPDAMLVDDLHKNYAPLCKKKVNAVKGISFSVKKGECFGLLGVNGAGKSSTFKMLTAEESPTRGNVFANGCRLQRWSSKYLQTLGYCPQFFGLDTFQTGEENLALLLTLRGFDQKDVEREVSDWIKIVGLEKFARRRVERYSGGMVRRLGAAAALCGRPELALLDEPSAGVDVAARRRLWAALRRALRHGRAVIITSHSMDEMEALCSRIAIMSSGRVRALGTAAALRHAHAQGHAVVFKLTHALNTDEVDGAKSQMNKLKGKLQEIFNCTLKDEHKTMLHYHINESMRYSDLFAQLEALQAEFPSLIEDYSVTETTLEEVFLAFAKEHQEESQTTYP